MALLDLARALRTAASGGSLTLDRATLTNGTGFTLDPGFDDLVRKAYDLGATGTWTLAVTPEQIPDPSNDELRISKGTSSFLSLSLTNVTIDLRFRAGSGTTLIVTVEIGLVGWTFTKSFPYADGRPFDQISYTDPAFVFASELVPAYARAQGPIRVAAGQNFAAMLAITGAAGTITKFISGGGSGPFPFVGPIDVDGVNQIPKLRPPMRPRAVLTGTPIEIGALKLSSPFVELRVVTLTDLDEQGKPVVKQSAMLAGGFSMSVGDGAAGFSVDLVMALRENPKTYSFYVASSPDKPLTPTAVFALVGGQSWGDAIPAPLRSAFETVAFKSLQTTLTSSAPPKVQSFDIRVGSTKPLQLFDAFSIDEFDVLWSLVADGEGGFESTVGFEAYFQFFPTIFKGEFFVSITSKLIVAGGFTGSVHFGDVVKGITGGAIDIPQSVVDFELTSFQLWLDVRAKRWLVTAAGNASFDPLGNGGLALEAISLQIASNPDSSGKRLYDGSISATFVIGSQPLAVSAAYATADGWTFRLGTIDGQSLSISALLNRLFAAAKLPEFLPDNLLTVTNLALEAQTGGTKAGSFSASAVLHLAGISLGPLGQFSADAALLLKRTGGATPTTSGSFTFSTTIPVINARVQIGYAFNADGSKVVSLVWGPFTTTYDTTKSTLSFSVGEASLGQVLAQIVGLITGDEGYRLPAPWSVLDQISLRGFSIVYDLTKKTVSIDYKLPSPINLGFLTINGLTIEKKDKITVTLDATFLDGKKVPPFDPLGQMPATPGGPPIDLRLLALGQRVTVPGIEKSKNIDAAIKLLASFTDTPSGSGLPAGPTFSASSPWLIGLHLLVMGSTVELEVVFVDPLLYGLRIALSGEKAGPFKGLDFEILYKRVTDTIGVYQIRLTLPDKMRFLQFGALAITLPIVGVDVYTNGDFKIDFGFPANMDFSRSFGVQYFPFTGAGGFYFAKLSGATQTALGKPSVPGQFDPVIQFGLGLQLGLGKDISAGILKAGISITVFGIVEGIIARWVPAAPSNAFALPDDAAHEPGTALAPVRASLAADSNPNDVATSYYYKIAGTIGIIGKVYGSIDFAIIKASLNLTITIALQAVIEAHMPFLVAFTASVDVSLSVSIDLGLFSITIHLSFSTTIRESFTLGQRTDAPWGTLGPPPTNALATASHAFALQAASYVATLDFQPFVLTEQEERVPVNLSFVMHPSVVSDPANASSATGTIVAMLYLDAPDPTAAPPPLPPPKQPLPPAPTSFERFAETVFVWVVAAFGASALKLGRAEFAQKTITRARVHAAYQYLTSTTNQRPISYDDDIVPGLYSLLQFTVTAGTSVKNAAPFPMIPELRLECGTVNRRFADGVQVDDTYLGKLRTYFEQIAACYQNELQKKYNGGGAPPRLMTARTSATTSFSAAIVEDMVLMLARGMTKAALDVMDAYAYPYGGATLAAIVADLNTLGNTLDVPQLAAANATVPLAAGAALTLTRVRYQLTADDTFAGIVSRFGITDAAAVVSDDANANQGGVLRPNVMLTSGALSYETRPGDTFARIVTEQAGWTYAALADALQHAATAFVPLSVLVLPTVRYAAAAGDTLTSVANAFGLAPDALANDVAGVGGLFADPKGTFSLSVPNLVALSPDLLLGRMRVNEAAANLAGANARFLLAGMRPPAPAAGDTLGAPAAMYDLNGQQIAVSSATTATLSINAAQPWITFSGGPTALSVQLDVTSANALANAFVGVVKQQGVPATVHAIVPQQTFTDHPRRFTLRRTAVVQAAETIAYSFSAGTAGAAATPRLWFVPTALELAIAEPKALLPAFTLEATAAGNPPVVSAPQRYGWATVVDVEIKRNADQLSRN